MFLNFFLGFHISPCALKFYIEQASRVVCGLLGMAKANMVADLVCRAKMATLTISLIDKNGV